MKIKERLNKLIKELEAEMATCSEEDQFGYAKIDAYDVYKKVIKRLREINIPEEIYKKMWREFYKTDWYNVDLKYEMDELEQKYFPKEEADNETKIS